MVNIDNTPTKILKIVQIFAKEKIVKFSFKKLKYIDFMGDISYQKYSIHLSVIFLITL
jgi:hypothetical protein